MDTKKFEALLLKRKSDLLDTLDVEEDAGAIVELDQSKVGRLSRMDAMQAQAMSKETLRRHQLEIQQINQALQRIKDDDYGYCLECGEEISLKRLEINPSTKLCISCAEKLEQSIL